MGMGIGFDFGKITGDAAKTVGDVAAAAGKGVVDVAGAAGGVVADAAGAAGRGIADVAGTVGGAASVAAHAAGTVVKGVMPGGEGSPITGEQVQELLGVCYQRAVDGIPNVSKPIDELVLDYTSKYRNLEDAARAMVNMQLAKNATSGFLSGAAGFFALPIAIATIPANICNVLYVQLRMAVALAAMGGYDVRSDQVQTMVYVCLAGSAGADLLKDAGIKAVGKFAKHAIKQIPGAALVKINQAVGFRLVTKFGETGIVNLGKMIPIAGGVVGGAFDFATTKAIADVAYGYFIGDEEGGVIDEETIETVENAIVSACEDVSEGHGE